MVFSLNTLVGFACSLGVDINFNSDHHGEDEVITIQQTDKLINNHESIIYPDITFALPTRIYKISLSVHVNIVRDIKYFVRNYHPPIPDSGH